MQSANLQKDKLELIEKIIRLEDKSTLDYIKSILTEETSEYELTDEQKLIVEEATAKYYSGEEPSFTWEEIKKMLEKAISKTSKNPKKNLNNNLGVSLQRASSFLLATSGRAIHSIFMAFHQSHKGCRCYPSRKPL